MPGAPPGVNASGTPTARRRLKTTKAKAKTTIPATKVRVVYIYVPMPPASTIVPLQNQCDESDTSGCGDAQ